LFLIGNFDMKIRDFSVLATLSLLSFGAIAGCAQTAQTPAIPTAEVATEPCGSESNPCPSKSDSVGAPLAQELQGKPVVVDVFATWCPACTNVAPTLSQLKQDYEGKVNFVVLDVSDKSTTSEAEATAQRLGLSQFLAANKTQTGSLTVIDPATGDILVQHRNNANLADYTTVLDKALTQ
jgi:thiol-disulfide isomerase/thioredoxin